MDLQYLASFGDHVPLSQFKPDDTIGALSFSSDGTFLASGDNAGRVVIFRLNKPTTSNGRYSVSFVTQVHAHKACFDYFRSELAEMKINALQWLPTNTLNPKLLTCNSHEVKLWALFANPKITWSPFNPSIPIDQFIAPVPRQKDTKYSSECLKTFTDVQTEYIVDLQTLSDQRSFLIVDVSCVKLWDVERSVPSVSLFEVSQQQPELVASATSPFLPSNIVVGDDGGLIRVLDTRTAAEDVSCAIEFDVRSSIPKDRCLDGCESIGSLAFTPDGSAVVARTFGEAQVWDLRFLNPKNNAIAKNKPLSSIQTQWFPGQMEWLSSDDYVKDPFKTSITPSGKIITGLYSADFLTWDYKHGKTGRHRAVSARTPRPPAEPGRDFTKRVTCCAAHPTQEIVAVVSTAALFLFNEKPQ